MLTLQNTKDEIVAAIEAARAELNIEKPADEAWLPSIQKKTLLVILAELETMDNSQQLPDRDMDGSYFHEYLTDEQEAAADAEYNAYRARVDKLPADLWTGVQVGEISIDEAEAEVARREADATYRLQHPEFDAESATSDRAPDEKFDPILDPPVTADELARAKAKIAQTAEELIIKLRDTSTSAADRKKIRAQLRKRGYWLSKRIEAQNADDEEAYQAKKAALEYSTDR